MNQNMKKLQQEKTHGHRLIFEKEKVHEEYAN